MYISPDDFSGSDSERLNRAAARAAELQVPVRIGKRCCGDGRDWWLLDSAILLPSNTTVILENCRIKLSDRCRDNFFRSANCIPGGGFVPQAENIHISGIGHVVLEGADDPRSTGDSAKQNMAGTDDYISSYGSDGLIPGADPTYGNWRNIGILLVHVKHFSLCGLTIRNAHCWSVSLEYCTDGTVRDLAFDAAGHIEIHGRKETIRNQDGLDLRRGCKRILIENIRGVSGDDVVALTAVAGRTRPAGVMDSTEFCGMQPEGEVNDTCHIIIRNVQATCSGGHHIVRFLNNGGVKLHHIQLENVMDTSPDDFHVKAAVKVGDTHYGGLAAPGDTYGLQISRIMSNAAHAILLAGPLTDSRISDVINFNKNGKAITRCAEGDTAYRNLFTTGISDLD